jgi:hypothetical protein
MKKTSLDREQGSTLVVTIAVVSLLLVLLGVAVDYTTQISRNTQRSRKTALAMEIADGHLEALFTNWRNIYRTTWSTAYGLNTGGTDFSMVGTNYFYTICATCSPAPVSSPAPTPVPSMAPSATPPKISLPPSTLFPSEANYTVTQYRIQAVDPMITLDSSGNAMVEGGSKGMGGYVAMSNAVIPPIAFGPNKVPAYNIPGGFPYSLYYLAAVDVTVPTTTKNVTAKVRRVFEKKFDLPWTYAMFYVDDLEFQPTSAFTLSGPIHTNSNLFIGTNNFTAGSRVEYGHDFVNGYSPNDPRYPGSGITAPNFAKSDPTLALSDMPPSQVSPYLPFGWNLALSTGGSGANDDSYHEIIERPATSPDPLIKVRYYSQAGYQIVIGNDSGGTGSYTVTKILPATTAAPNPTPQTVTGTAKTKLVGNSGGGDSTTVFKQGQVLYDTREGAVVKVTDVDVSKIVSAISSLSDWTGLLYIADSNAATYNTNRTVKTAGNSVSATVPGTTTTQSTTKRAFRLINGSQLPAGGLTIVSENPVYIKGDYNTSSNGSAPPSNSGIYTDPDAGSYTRVPAAIIADAITVLSANWDDSKSVLNPASARATPANTTINAALVTGNVPSSRGSPGGYSGGGENFIRLLEDWSTKTLCYYGSMVQLFQSNQAIGFWNSDANYYVAPQTSRFYYDATTFADAAPPGNLQIAAYLQQQRWYQVY